MSVVLLADVKAHLNITSTTNDAELQRMTDRAEAFIVARCGPLAPLLVVDEVHTGPGPLLLKRFPVISLTSVTDDGTLVIDTDLDVDAGVVHGVFSSLRRGLRVTYTAGRQVLPADLEAAVLDLAAHLWGTQRGSSPGLLGLQDETQQLAGTSTYLLPYRVQTAIEPHLLPTGVA